LGLPTGGRYLPTGGRYLPTGGRYLPTGGRHIATSHGAVLLPGVGNSQAAVGRASPDFKTNYQCANGANRQPVRGLHFLPPRLGVKMPHSQSVPRG
jgi:hypothetical protein